MFERRLKVLLMILMVACAALAIRAAQIQLIQHDHWQRQALQIMKREEFVETSRGAILDRNGQKLAVDAPCTDACVDYHVIPEVPDEDWLQSRAIQNLKARNGESYGPLRKSKQWQSDKWKPVLDDECDRMRDDIAAMWQELAVVGDKTPEKIDQLRADIVQRVEMRKRYIWWRNYQQTEDRSKIDSSSSWYRQFLSDSARYESAVDKFEVEVGEEISPHMILHKISPTVQARLARQRDRFPFLTLEPSKYREYPFGRVGCNVIGYLRAARPEEIEGDASLSDTQLQANWGGLAARFWSPSLVDQYGISKFRELRKYWLADLVGRAGLESFCENTLRGTRGQIQCEAVSGNVIDKINAISGHDLHTSIDILLQQDIENDFVKTRILKNDIGKITETRYNEHGAAVVIKLDTNEVLAMVSNPGFDLNDLDAHLNDYFGDALNRPMLNRATQMDVVPGSTVKTIVGAGSITDGTMGPNDKIQCRGTLYIDGQAMGRGHCWIYAVCKGNNASAISHGPSGAGDPRIGPDDMLTITDGIRESCDIVFENIAMRMKMSRLSEWYGMFGLGHRTGIGIEENAGLLAHPEDGMSIQAKFEACLAGIGQSSVQATPIQMANVAATLARDGIWMRPRLVSDDVVGRAGQTAPDFSAPDRVDLHLSRPALDAVQTGMRQVCEPTGSGEFIRPEKIERGPGDLPLSEDPLVGMKLAGKTGSAQTGGFMPIVEHDPNGKPYIRQVHFGDPGTEGWYHQPNVGGDNPEKHLAHAWFIGYAPADHPQIAFAVLVEYGESGGRVAGPIAHDLLVDCVKHGYLSTAK